MILAPLVGADVAKVKRAAQLSKADLLTEVVGEFPEVQGLMGRYYALAQGEDKSVAAAIEEHYKPQGPDRSRADRSGVDCGRARRQARYSHGLLGHRRKADRLERPVGAAPCCARRDPHSHRQQSASAARQDREVAATFSSFFADRLKVQLREQGARHDLVDAVFALEGQDDLLLVVRRVEALGKFLDSDDGKNLLAGIKRAANILRIEEKKDGKAFNGAVDASKLDQIEEKTLAIAIAAAEKDAAAAVAKEDFAAAMTALAKLRPAVDAFFDKVTVNADDKAVRENRLTLLNQIRAATLPVADFSKIAGYDPASARRSALASGRLGRRVDLSLSSYELRCENRTNAVAHGTPRLSCVCFGHLRQGAPMTVSIANLQPIVALIAGVLILIMPRLLNFIVAIYLIVIGILGLGILR